MDYRNKEIKVKDKINYFRLVLCELDEVYDLEIVLQLIWFF